jgi:FkbM family methyltransferase
MFSKVINKIRALFFLDIRNRISDIENRISSLQIPGNVVKLDTCEKLLSESTYEDFTGDIKNKYLRLIKGLDHQSVQTIVRIISRIHRYRKEGASYFWFTEFERIELAKIHDLHASSILRLSEDCYAYGKYLLPCNIISTTVFYYDHFLNHVENLEVVKNGEIIDVGGFIGDSAVVLSGYTDKSVHVFEPVTSLFEMCKKAVFLNDLGNVILKKQALGAVEEKKAIFLSGDTSGFVQTQDSKEKIRRAEEVDVITLDQYVQKNNLKVGLIKVDVEGFEQEFLKGAEQTIKTQKPVLLLSVYHNSSDFFEIKPLIESWNLGYKFKVVKPSDQTIIIDTTLIAEVR